MTTIVLSNNVMSSDSQATSSYAEFGFKKIYETEVGVYGMAGDVFDFEVLIKALDTLYSDYSQDDGDGGVLLVRPDSVMVETNHSEDLSSCIFFIKETGETGYAKLDANGCVRRFTQKQPLVVGSGSDFAITALQLGNSSKKAVQAAVGLDPFSGGDVVSVRCTKKRSTKKKAKKK